MAIYGSSKKLSKFLLGFFLLCLSVAAAKVIVLPSLSTGELSPRFEGRTDLTLYYSGGRTVENMVIKPQGGARKRPGTLFIDSRNPDVNIPGVPGTPAVLGTYKYTYISENGSIWGVPLTDVGVVTLDAGSAVNIGGGIVGLPYNNASEDGVMRFVSGEVVNIKGTTNYEGNQTLTAGTTITQLQFADTYIAETLDGTETVSKKIAALDSGGGRMVKDSSGNLYYGHTWSVAQSTYVTKIQTDGTLVYNFLTPNPAWPILLTSDTLLGLAISSDDQFLYTLIRCESPTYYGYVSKFNLSTGAEVWRSAAVNGVTSWPGYDLAIDADGNAYAPFSNGASVVKFASADGAATEITLPTAYAVEGGFAYEIEIENNLGKCVVAGTQYIPMAWGDTIYNMVIMDLDGTNQIPVLIGGYYQYILSYYSPTIGTGNIAIYNNYIYVLTFPNGTTPTLYKYDFSGNLDTSAVGPTYGLGLYIDLWGNLVVINIDSAVQTTNRYWFYDTSLNYLGVTDPFATIMLWTWDAAAGGSWIQGNAIFNGELGTPEGAPSVPDTYYEFIGNLAESPVRIIPFEHSIDNAYILELGHYYIGFLHEAD